MDSGLRQALARYDLDSLGRSGDVVYVIDADLRLRFVNQRYEQVADAVTGGEVLETYPLGSCVVDGIDAVLRSHYTDLFEATLQTGEPRMADYHCHTPEEERTFRCMIYPLGTEGLLTVHGELESRPWPKADVEAVRDPDTGLVSMCAGCRRVRMDEGGWRHVPQFIDEAPRDTTHGLCDPCLGFYLGATARGAQR